MKIKSTLAIVLSLILTACGSGGSDDNTGILSPTVTTNAKTTSTSTTNNTTNTNNTGTIGSNVSIKDQNKTPTPTTLNTAIQGVTAQVNTTGTFGMGGSTATPDINTIVIGGKNITLDSNLKSGTTLTNARYGYFTQRGTTPALIAQGFAATEVPTTGKATYRGSAVHLTDNATTSQVVSATFTADFDKKTLAGTIRTATPITLGATIAGNRFAGTVGDFATSGYFYGEKADELAGIYKNSNSTISGAYGAKK